MFSSNALSTGRAVSRHIVLLVGACTGPGTGSSGGLAVHCSAHTEGAGRRQRRRGMGSEPASIAAGPCSVPGPAGRLPACGPCSLYPGERRVGENEKGEG